MSRARKKARTFVLENRQLGLDRLVRETGLSRRRVRRLLAEAEPAAGPAESLSKAEPPRVTWALAGLVATLTVLVYLPALSNGFVNWDDPSVVLDNLRIRRLDAESLRWMLTTFHAGNWIPLTWLSHALDYRLWGLNARMHHLTSVLLHAVNAALVFFLCLRLLRRARHDPSTGASTPPLWTAALAALLFGLHPLHVESVAWVSERKDLLCGLFVLASLLAYLRHVSEEERRPRYPWASLGFFGLALLAKPMAVTLPLVLLMLDAWPRGRLRDRLRSALLEKAPFLALALVSGVLTIRAQAAAGAIAASDVLPLGFRVMNAFHSVVFYLTKMLVPVGLVPFYPIPAVREVSTAQVGAALVVVALSGFAVLAARRRRPGPLVAWACYLVTLAPVLGLIQVGHQRAADRYAYLPSVSLLLLLAAGLARLPFPRFFPAFAAVLVAALGALSVGQIAVWRSAVTLWERVTAAYPDVSAVAHTNMANAYRQTGRADDAIREYRRALALAPPHAFTRDGLGAALLDQGRADEAIREFRAAISLDPAYAPAHRNLWFAYRRKGLEAEARAAAAEAVRIAPDFAAAWSNLGISYAQEGRLAESEEALRRAVALDPDNPQYLGNLATTLGRSGSPNEALELYRRARRLDPDEPVYALNLANTYLQRGRVEAAITELEDLVARRPDEPVGHARLGEAYRRAGRAERAAVSFRRALALAPDLPEARVGLGRLRLPAGDIDRVRPE